MRALPFSLAALAWGAASPALAVDCAVTPCPATPSAAAPAPRFTIDDARQLRSIGDMPPLVLPDGVGDTGSASAIGLPFAVEPQGSGFSAKASTGTWRDYSNRELARRIEELKASGPPNLTLPKSDARLKPPIELWSKVDVENGSATGDSSTRTGVGADYKIGRSTSVGVSAERGETRPGVLGAGRGEDQNVGAHMRVQAVPGLSLDASTAWEASRTGAVGEPERSSKHSVTLQPRVGQPIAVGDGKTVEPFVTMKHELDLSTSGVPGTESSSAGAGVTLQKPDSYSLSLTTDVEGLASAQEKSLDSKVQLKLPLP